MSLWHLSSMGKHVSAHVGENQAFSAKRLFMLDQLWIVEMPRIEHARA